jgi:hypothetical protein
VEWAQLLFCVHWIFLSSRRQQKKGKIDCSGERLRAYGKFEELDFSHAVCYDSNGFPQIFRKTRHSLSPDQSILK